MSSVLARLAITQSELFADWPGDAVDRLIEAAGVLNLDAGSHVHRSGESADYLYLLVSGSLRLTRRSSGRDFTAWLYFAGDCHGIGPAIAGSRFVHTATCKEATTLVRISGALIREMIRADGNLAISLFAALDRRYRNALALYESAATFSTSERIAGLIQSLVARAGRSGKASEVSLSQDEIAAMLGTRRQVVNRALREMEAAGIVQVRYGGIAVTDQEKLVSLARTGG
ncbi:MAG: Crp/Fnr family transcriptional regulator [Burkholderiaceae bacterium]